MFSMIPSKDPSEHFGDKFHIQDKNKIGFAYVHSPRKCSNVKNMTKIERKESKKFSCIDEGHIRF
jgi:hypothetical protein